MFIKFFALPFSLLVFIATSCLAEVVEVKTNEPSSEYVGMRISLQGRDFVERIPLGPNKFISINKDLTDVRILKDKVTGLNKFSALVAYNIHLGKAKPSFTRYLYVQCPVTRETYIDRTPPPTEEFIDGEKVMVFYTDKINRKVLREEVLYSGSYSFLSSSEHPVARLSNDFPMVGKVRQFLPVEAMCLKIQVAHAEDQWSKAFRNLTLKKYGISE